jgi:DNA-binding response OmpR family regulator
MPRYKILVVDDQELIRQILTRYLTRSGYDVVNAQNGEEAITLYRIEHPALVISDIQMPKMNGLDLLREIKAIDERAFVILISGHGSEEILLQALRGGAINFFRKPFQVEEVVEVLQQVLRHRETIVFPELDTPTLREEEKRFAFTPPGPNILPLINQIVLNARPLFSDADIINIRIGIEEMLNNAIEHGCLGIGFDEKNTALHDGVFEELVRKKTAELAGQPRQVLVSSRLTGSTLEVVIRDEGKGFDWQGLRLPAQENLLHLNGRGIFLTRIFFDAVEYNERGNEVTLRKTRTKPPAA